MNNYVHPGDVIPLTAPVGGVVSGGGYIIGELFAVAAGDADAGDEFQGKLTGVFDLAKTSAQAWTQGQPIYWDNANDRADSDPSLGPLIGVATEAAANPSSTGRVKLIGGVLEAPGFGNVTNGPAATSITTAGAGTYSAAALLSGMIVRDCAGASRTDTLSTAALLVAAIPGCKVGDIVKCHVVNGSDAAETITLAEGTGGAFPAAQTAAARVIPQFGRATLHIRITNVTAAAEAYVVCG